MVLASLKSWIDTLSLDPDGLVLAQLALGLAAQFDEQANTSTAAELRKTVLELRRMVLDKPAFDPLDELLTRHVSATE
jgi:hypothetical protein